MNSLEARRILLLYRPDNQDAAEPEVAAALEFAQRDREVKQWFENHCAFQTAMRAKLREIPVPEHLREALLAQRKIIRLPLWWQKPLNWLAAAAALVFFLGLAAIWSRPRTPDRFSDYRSRMVRTALREYRMDVVTNDMRQVRQFMAQRGAPADYVVPAAMEPLRLTGGGLLRWRSHPVAMVCFDRGDQQMLFLFVMNRSAVKDPPPSTPQAAKVSKLTTVSWSQQDKTYVLAGPDELDFARKYLRGGG